MPSIAKHIYPQMVWRDREKKLWNSIHKKALKNLPEERVRLRVMEALIQRGWSKHRISTEEAIGKLGDTSMRTDLICYSQQFDPKLLVECKAEYISISAKTAEQVARYNQKVGAPYLLMTNGISDFWYAIDENSGKVNELQNQPELLNKEQQQLEYDFDDWKQRGFAGEKASPELRLWLKETLPDLWLSSSDAKVQFLTFSNSPSDIDLNHYYRIVQTSETRRLALTTLNTAFGGNRFVIILNKENENKAVLEINLDVLFAEKNGNSSVYSRQGIKTFDLSNYIDLKSITKVDNIVKEFDKLFIEYVD
ncbi:type I restriction enzyme HsdR N-terminal domain-containing protein [Fodinibius sp.]|uniref:type I restriction enzyme HsdR N-terminal domain-containing protein n=1 Tax=Fodinibius sp. TaxID=1872440 RepID=UPI002ACDC479|nr:type I restriction enzyme HsdR N-terminal domain-containing protein [Fodinibius sp.]MDZ7658930.1 type I restriction enzyme HsdR N-terminal domain-containing protein [Fodinibius sp.]